MVVNRTRRIQSECCECLLREFLLVDSLITKKPLHLSTFNLRCPKQTKKENTKKNGPSKVRYARNERET